jgi:hypothetical protein
MKFVLRVAAAAAVLAALLIPAVPASASTAYGKCQSTSPNWAKRCVTLEFSAGSVRAYGSLNDLAGTGTVAVFAFLQFRACGECGWRTIQTSPRLEAHDGVLTATLWNPYSSGVGGTKVGFRAVLNWNYRNGQNSGRIFSPIVNL